MTGELIKQNGDTIDATDALEMRLDLFRACTVVYVADKDTPRVDIFFALAHLVSLVVDGLLHLTQLLCFFFHLLDAAPHCGDLFLLIRIFRGIETLIFFALLLKLDVGHGRGMGLTSWQTAVN
jgi:hypothetical protein